MNISAAALPALVRRRGSTTRKPGRVRKTLTRRPRSNRVAAMNPPGNTIATATAEATTLLRMAFVVSGWDNTLITLSNVNWLGLIELLQKRDSDTRTNALIGNTIETVPY